MKKLNAKVGDNIQGDDWGLNNFYALEPDSGYKDSSYPGCQFRYTDRYNNHIGVNIVTTGKPHWNECRYQSRCKIEVVGDGEPSTIFGGLLYHRAIRYNGAVLTSLDDII